MLSSGCGGDDDAGGVDAGVAGLVFELAAVSITRFDCGLSCRTPS
jgi:hypothetical protein